jgi:hypothetical protein
MRVECVHAFLCVVACFVLCVHRSWVCGPCLTIEVPKDWLRVEVLLVQTAAVANVVVGIVHGLDYPVATEERRHTVNTHTHTHTHTHPPITTNNRKEAKPQQQQQRAVVARSQYEKKE